MKIVTVEHMRRIEADADANGMSYATMMDHAGRAAAGCAASMLSDRPDQRVTILVGKGNNGGDGLVCARYLATIREDVQVRVYMLARRPDDDPLMTPLFEQGIFIAYAEDDRDNRVLRNMVGSADLLIDALFGIGIRLPITGAAQTILRQTNRVIDIVRAEYASEYIENPSQPHHNQTPRSFKVLALDCPSGLDCDTGEIDSNAIPADVTITFIAPKTGLVTYPGADAVGQLQIAAIGIPEDLNTLQEPTPRLTTARQIKAVLPQRSNNSHKGTHGKALIVAGSANYIGAAGLSAIAAYRAGVGLVTVATTPTTVNRLAGTHPEPTWISLTQEDGAIAADATQQLVPLLDGYSTILAGPGLGQAPPTQEFLARLLADAHPLPSLVLDADALNILAKSADWHTQLPPETIITPHPGEMARISQLKNQAITADRLQIATQKAAEWDVILVLKGAHTIIAAPDGRVQILPFKNDGLATAGTGDILAGLIAGLRAQRINAFDAATIGAYVHGLAGEIITQQNGPRALIAGDILDVIGTAWQMIARS